MIFFLMCVWFYSFGKQKNDELLLCSVDWTHFFFMSMKVAFLKKILFDGGNCFAKKQGCHCQRRKTRMFMIFFNPNIS